MQYNSYNESVTHNIRTWTYMLIHTSNLPAFDDNSAHAHNKESLLELKHLHPP